MTDVKVSRLSRTIDLVSMVLIGGGGALFISAFIGMRELRDRPHEAFVPGRTVAFGRVAEHSRLTRTSRVGLGIAGLGIVVGLSAAAHHGMARRRAIAKI